MNMSDETLSLEKLLAEIESMRLRIAKLEEKEAQFKKTESRLREREEWYRTLFEAARDAVFTLKNGLFVDCNSITLEMFRCTREEIIGKSPVLFSPHYQEDGRKSAEKADEKIQLAMSGIPQIFDWCHKRCDGTFFQAEVFLNRVDFNNETFVQAIVRDLSIQSKAEAALRKSEEKFRLLTEGLKDVVLRISLEGILEYCSPVIKEFAGYTAEEELGQHISKYFAKKSELLLAMRLLEGIFQGAEPVSFEFSYKPKEGEPFPVEITGRPIRNNEEPVALQCVMRDVSYRRKAEDEKRQLREKLAQSEKMEAIGRLAGGVAHDLNNVLSAISSYPELLLTRLTVDDPMYRPLQTIRKSGLKAAAIVQDLLTLARRGVAVLEPVNLNEVLREYFDSPEYEVLRSLYPTVRVEISYDDELTGIMGSPVHLHKSVMNLITNAMEAMPEGGTLSVSTLKLAVSSLNLLPDGEEGSILNDYVVFTVSDTGIGIPERDLKKIFEPFYTRKVMGRSGTGLGMAVVWGTVQDHNGHINVNSREGVGTTMELYFPVTREVFRGMEKDLPKEVYRGNGEHILVVDDMPEQREITSEIIRELGYEVQAVASGEQALEYIKDNAVEMVILDMIMEAGMDGLNTYRILSEIQPGLKALIVSGYSETRRVWDAQELGVGEYIRKPFSIEQIALAIRKELHNS